MAVVALASAKGSPGVTTIALGLAAVWPRPVVLVEADPAGGDLAARFGAHRSPGLIEWAADSRASVTVHDGVAVGLSRYVQRLPGVDVDVVFGSSAEQMPAALGLLLSSGAFAAPAVAGSNEQAPDVLLDLGRLDPSSAVLGLASRAQLVLLFAHGWPDSLAAVAARQDTVQQRLRLLAGSDGVQGAPRIAVLLVGKTPYKPDEIQMALGLPVLGALPHDTEGADVLTGRRRAGRAWTRTPLPGACRSLAAELCSRIDANSRQSGASALNGTALAGPRAPTSRHDWQGA